MKTIKYINRKKINIKQHYIFILLIKLFYMTTNNETIIPLKDQEALLIHLVEETKNYLEAELKVLESVKSYKIIYQYLHQLPERIGIYIRNKVATDDPAFFELNRQYTSKAAELINRHANRYNWRMGSVPEDINKTLEDLANQVRSFKVESKPSPHSQSP
jgi:hypothetical protein